MSKISLEQFQALTAEALPLAAQFGFRIDKIAPGHVLGRVPFAQNLTRPGGTVAGPVLMGLADYAMYAIVMSLIGPIHGTVTTSLNINFLRRPGPVDVIADGHILKLGKRLAVCEVTLFSQGEAEPVAHVTGTYSIPPHPEESGSNIVPSL
jgi:uncharacterized protein (TIGR00369 family)